VQWAQRWPVEEVWFARRRPWSRNRRDPRRRHRLQRHPAFALTVLDRELRRRLGFGLAVTGRNCRPAHRPTLGVDGGTARAGRW